MGTSNFGAKVIKNSAWVVLITTVGSFAFLGSGCNSSTPPVKDHMPASESVVQQQVVATAASTAVAEVQSETIIVQPKAVAQVPPQAVTAEPTPLPVAMATPVPTPAPLATAVPNQAPTPRPVPVPVSVPVMLEPVAVTPTAKPSQVIPADLVFQKVDFWLWAGVGVNYTSSAQTVEGFSDLEFGRIKSMSTMLRAGFYASDSAGLELGLKNTPGEAKSSESVTVNNGDYNWVTLSADGLYRPEFNSGRSEWTWRLGVQQHQMPFLIPIDANEVSVVDTSLTNFSLGFDYKKKIKKYLRLETMLRYQYPIASSSSAASGFHVDPNTGFDGSIGAAYQISEHTYVGIYWYGQYHDFGFSYTTPSAAEVSGRQSLFFTNFDLRLGMEF